MSAGGGGPEAMLAVRTVAQVASHSAVLAISHP